MKRGWPEFDSMKKVRTLMNRAHFSEFLAFASGGFSRKMVPLESGVYRRAFSALPGSNYGKKMVLYEFKGHHRVNSSLSGIDFRGKMVVPLKCATGQYRVFSSSNSGEDEETDGGADEYDGEDESVRGESKRESSADPVEVTRVVKVIGELFALDRNMEAVLDECSINLTHDLVVAVLLRFQHARKPAFRFFCWVGERPGFQHNSRTYNVMLSIIGKTRQYETLRSLLDEMGEKRLLNLESCRIAVKSYAAGKERKRAVEVFELMKKYGFKVGAKTINCLLDALAREKLVNEAQALYERLKGRFRPNVTTYTILLYGWCKVRNLMEAGKIWNQMIDEGLKPELVAYNIMIEALLKAQKRSDATKLFEVMKAKGPTPSVRTYTIMIRNLCKQHKMRSAMDLFNEMVESGCEPDIVLYTCFITGFGNMKNMNMVNSLIKEIMGKGLPPDGRLYNALVKLMTNKGMPDEALRIYEKMKEDGVKPSIHTFNMIIKSYFFAKNCEMACAIWDEMLRQGCCPDENSYIVLIGGLIKQGRTEEACKYVEELIAKGMRIPDLDIKKFVFDVSRVGRPNILEELARKMTVAGKPEVSEIFARWAEMSQKRSVRRPSF